MPNSPVIVRAAKRLDSLGVDVTVLSEADTNGRPGDFRVRGGLRHHTASARGTSGLRVVREGRADLPGPLSQYFLARSAKLTVVTFGRANHAGNVREGIGIASPGNAELYGTEVDNDGRGEPYPAEQLEVARLIDAVTLLEAGLRPARVRGGWGLWGHKETSVTGKVDPVSSMDRERRLVADLMEKLSQPAPAPAPAGPAWTPVYDGALGTRVVRYLDRGQDVREVRALLGLSAG